MTDIKALKALAEAVETKEWHSYTPGGAATNPMRASFLLGPRRETMDRSEGFGEADAAFMAHANPASVLELIAQTEEDAMHMRAFGEVMRSQAEQIDQLKAENEALHAEATKWKNESVSDSQTIYSLSCNLAHRTGEVRELAGVVDDLAALTKKFVQRLSKAAPDNDLPAKALDYLGRKGLQGGAMREIVEGRLS